MSMTPTVPSLLASSRDISWDLILSSEKSERFTIKEVLDTKYVATLRLFPGIRPEMASAVLKMEGGGAAAG